MNPIIETHSLNRRFGRTEAVRELTFQVPEGSIYAFLGPNGAGKTTTIKMLLNILQPTTGTARILGVDSRNLGPHELAQIGYVSENQQLPEWMTVRQLIDYCKPMYPTWDDAFCEKLLKNFGLLPHRKLKNLSRGMKVKAALVTSLAYRPRLLVLDEPFSGLDPLVRDEFIRGMLELSEQSAWTIFISSHDIDEVERLADWVGVINDGQLHLSEPTESLQKRFRQIEFTVNAEITRLPATLPTTWLIPEMAGQNVRLVESQFREGDTVNELRRIFPGASEPTITPLSLRDIFLALAKTFRFKTESSKA
ncbi:MAG: ABC transporter ATP-binding protein [Methylacidiphilales bacterium]|nr:ABC transporter ATP-binding protein [Candidatus Methylacidiphilales bacterium]